MANPTGSVYLQADNSYTWVDGDIYEIVQTDEVEGAATGASFNGIGVDNQPHQVILNKLQLTHLNQLTDEVNISSLMTFAALFTSAVGPSGYLKLGTQDVSKGQIQFIVQWGVISLIHPAAPGGTFFHISGDNFYPFNFPVAFPNAVYGITTWLNANGPLYGGFYQGLGYAVWAGILSTISPLQKQGNVIQLEVAGANDMRVAKQAAASSDNTNNGVTGIGWAAIGY
jgi:hypothetical protein